MKVSFYRDIFYETIKKHSAIFCHIDYEENPKEISIYVW